MLNMFKAIQIIGIVTKWMTKALKDGKVTTAEALDLAIQIAPVLGVKTEITSDLDQRPKPPTESKE